MKRLVAFWDARESTRALDLARGLVAIVVLVDLASLVVTGALDVLYRVGSVDGASIGVSLIDGLLPSEPAGTTILAAAIAGLAVAFGAGRLPLVTGPLLVFLLARLAERSPPSDRAIDELLRIVVLVLSFVPSRPRAGAGGDRAFAWPRRLVVIQLVLLYFGSGLVKLDPAWHGADRWDAVALVLRNPAYVVDPVPLLTSNPWLTALATRAVVIFERSAPLLLLGPAFVVEEFGGRAGRLLRWHRNAFVVTGIAFHLGLAATTTLGIFPWGCLALYPCLFRGDELDSIVGAIFRRGPLAE